MEGGSAGPGFSDTSRARDLYVYLIGHFLIYVQYVQYMYVCVHMYLLIDLYLFCYSSILHPCT